jgi:hypothetical protein
MDTLDKARLALTTSAGRHGLDGAWWPRSRTLSDELVPLFAAWPAEAGYMSRVYISPRDWDDAPTSVAIPYRRGRVKVGLLSADTTNQLVLIMIDGQRRSLAVIPSIAPAHTAAAFMSTFGGNLSVARVEAMPASRQDSAERASDDPLRAHNAAVDESALRRGRCAQVHLPTGDICAMRAGHEGSCTFGPAR